jgi:hypothetical protein
VFRYRILEALDAVYSDAWKSVPLVDALIAELDSAEEHPLSGESIGKYWLMLGLLSSYSAEAILRGTSSMRLATGFVRSAFASYEKAECSGFCHSLRRLYPDTCPQMPKVSRLPSQVFATISEDPKSSFELRASPPDLITTKSTASTTSHSTGSQVDGAREVAEKGDQLDTLT